MYVRGYAGPAAAAVADTRAKLSSKTKPSPQEFMDAYAQGLRVGNFTGRMIFTLDYVDGVLRRYRIQEPAKTLHKN